MADVCIGPKNNRLPPECEILVKDIIKTQFKEYEELREKYPLSDSEIKAIGNAVKPLIQNEVNPLKEDFNSLKSSLRTSRVWVGIIFSVIVALAAVLQVYYMKASLNETINQVRESKSTP